MDVTFDQSTEGYAIISLNGRLDIPAVDSVEDRFLAKTQAVESHVVLNMSDVNYIGSSGIRLILTGAKTLSKRGFQLVVINVQSFVEDAMLSAGVQTVLPIFDTEVGGFDYLNQL